MRQRVRLRHDGPVDPTKERLLLLDVDGPLNPWSGKAWKLRRSGFTEIEVPDGTGVDYRVWLNPELGARLATAMDELGLRGVWCTTWGELANAEISPRLGLPRLEVVPLTRRPESGRAFSKEGWLFWKTPQVVEWAQGRRFFWLDDELRRIDERYLGRHAPNSLGCPVNPSTGVRAADLARLYRWVLDA